MGENERKQALNIICISLVLDWCKKKGISMCETPSQERHSVQVDTQKPLRR